jgi:hypothetical protein
MIAVPHLAAAPLPTWMPALFPFAFAGMWVFMTTLLALIAGHFALLQRFPPVAEPTEDFHFVSGRMRGVSFSSALHVGLGAQGLHLAPNWLFRPLVLRGIPCIPWNRVTLVRSAPERGLFAGLRPAQFEVRDLGVRFSIHGDAARAIEQRLVAASARRA